MTELLVGRQHRQHVLVLSDLAGVRHQAGFSIGCLDGLHQVDRNQCVFHQFELTGAVLKIGPAHVFSPLMGLHDPGAVLPIRFAIGARNVFTVQHVFGLHAGRILGVAADHQINAADGSCKLDVARRLSSMIAVFVVTHVGGRDHHVRLAAQLRHHFCSLRDRVAELDILEVVRHRHLGGVFRGQAHHAKAQATECEHLVSWKHALTTLVNIGCQHRKLNQRTLHFQNRGGLVELMIAHGHGVVSKHVHAFEIGHRVLQIRFRNPGIDVATVQQQAVATRLCHFRTNLVDHGFARCHAVLAVAVFPEPAVVVVGVQDRDVVDLVFFRSHRRGGCAAQQGQRDKGSQNVLGRVHERHFSVFALIDYGRSRLATQ